MDIAPTLLEFAEVKAPTGTYNDREAETMEGESLLEKLTDSQSKGREHAPDRVIAAELFGKRSVQKGDWKLVHMPAPYGNDDWQLFDLATDIGEAHDVAGEYPGIVARLKVHWNEYAKRNGVIIPDWVSGY